MNNLTELKTSELEGAALDWAVGRAAGVDFGPDSLQSPREVIVGGYQGRPRVQWAPRLFWSQLGPLVDRFWREITSWLFDRFNTKWRDSIDGMPGDIQLWFCRAIAGSVFGDTVGIPTYLLEA